MGEKNLTHTARRHRLAQWDSVVSDDDYGATTSCQSLEKGVGTPVPTVRKICGGLPTRYTGQQELKCERTRRQISWAAAPLLVLADCWLTELSSRKLIALAAWMRRSGPVSKNDLDLSADGRCALVSTTMTTHHAAAAARMECLP